jgi:hypothetical protein
MRERNVTLVFVSHSPTELRALCTRSLWLDHGRVREIGETDGVIGHYLAHAAGGPITTSSRSSEPAAAPPTQPTATATSGAGGVTPLSPVSHRFGNRRAEVVGADITDKNGTPVQKACAGEELVVRVEICARDRVERPIIGFLMRNERGETIYGTNTAREQTLLEPLNAGERVRVSFQWTAPAFATLPYAFTVGVSDGELTAFETCDYAEDALTLDFSGADVPAGEYMSLPWQARWAIEDVAGCNGSQASAVAGGAPLAPATAGDND